MGAQASRLHIVKGVIYRKNVIASAAKQSSKQSECRGRPASVGQAKFLDCFVASLLAMTFFLYMTPFTMRRRDACAPMSMFLPSFPQGTGFPVIPA